jgi:catechol 2,3-dioxygenase-like lactoylglutathione lyase family enzyme
MTAQLSYTILFVANMDQAVIFYRDVLGLPLKFQSPYWSEFSTGETKLALHPASDTNPAGKVQLGFHVPDLQAFYKEMTSKGITFTQPPTLEEGSLLARFLDPQGTEVSVSQG